MASLGHVVVGMTAARLYPSAPLAGRAWMKAAVGWSFLSMLPDADVIGFAFGVGYGDEWGHRGATHSIVFSLALGAAIGALAPRFDRPALRTAITASAVLASHALLDTLTNGGLGCALWWPFDLTRYFAPWTPITVAPIGLAFLSPYGLMVTATELVLFAPLLWFALRGTSAQTTADTHSGVPRMRMRHLRHALLLSLWLVVTWLLISDDRFRDRLLGVMVRDDTEFTRRFSEEAMQAIQPGQREDHVREHLGVPFYEVLVYPDFPDACVLVFVEGDAVRHAQPDAECRKRGVEAGTSRAATLERLGPTTQHCWMYSRSPGGRTYRARAVCFENGQVNLMVRRWFRD